MQLLEYIMNRSPCVGVGLSRERWTKSWSALIRILRKTDRLSRPYEDNDDDEPNPEDALNPTSYHTDT